MTFDWRPWRQMLPIWLPAVILAFVLAGFFFYQTSDSVGRKATLASDIEERGTEVERLRMLHGLVVADRQEQLATLVGTLRNRLDLDIAAAAANV